MSCLWTEGDSVFLMLSEILFWFCPSCDHPQNNGLKKVSRQPETVPILEVQIFHFVFVDSRRDSL